MILFHHLSHKIVIHWKQYDGWRDAWQNQMMSTTAGRWFPEFVAFNVTTFNYKAYLANVNRRARRRYHDVVDETALARQTRIDEQEELLTTLSERAGMWKRGVEKQIAETGATLQAMGPVKRQSNEGERYEKHLARLRQDLAEVDAFQGLPLRPNNYSADAIGADEPCYHDLSREKAYHFWRDLLDLEAASNFWNFAKGSIPIGENLYSNTMGAIVAQTFVIAAYNAWEMVLEPRAENAALQKRLSEKDVRTVYSQCNGRPFQEQPLVVYAKVKALQLAMFNDMPGIECVIVPAKGPNSIG